MDNLPRHVLIVAAVLALVLCAGLATQAAGGTVRAPAVIHLVLNEADYDNVGTDNREFVEVFNGTGSPVDLGDKAVVLVNGLTGTEYTRVALGPNCLAPNQYLVVMDRSSFRRPVRSRFRSPAWTIRCRTALPTAWRCS